VAKDKIRDEQVENVYKGKKLMTQNDVAKLTDIIRNTKYDCTGRAINSIKKADKAQKNILMLEEEEKDLMQGL